jgi:hypothetical protein
MTCHRACLSVIGIDIGAAVFFFLTIYLGCSCKLISLWHRRRYIVYLSLFKQVYWSNQVFFFQWPVWFAARGGSAGPSKPKSEATVAFGLPVHPVRHLLTTSSSSVCRTSSFRKKSSVHLIPDGYMLNEINRLTKHAVGNFHDKIVAVDVNFINKRPN